MDVPPFRRANGGRRMARLYSAAGLRAIGKKVGGTREDP
jgi:hypothetical protein